MAERAEGVTDVALGMGANALVMGVSGQVGDR